MMEIGGKNILFDPFISPNPKASEIDVSTINPDYILISHGHGDHVADAVEIATRSKAQVIAAYEIAEWLKGQGVENVVPMNTGGSFNLGVCKIKAVKAVHSSSLPDGSYGGNPMGFVVSTDNFSLYYAGDTALTVEMGLLGKLFNLNWAVLPVGDHFTMGVEDALHAAEMVECNQVIGMHFDTFPPIEIDHQAAKNHFESNGHQLILPAIAQTIQLQK